MQLAVKEFYLNGVGEIVKIQIKNLDKFEDGNENIYSKSGVNEDNRLFDLIAHIPKELHYRICDMVNNYHTDKKAKFHIDNSYINRKE